MACELHLIFGPMFAGKSTELLSRFHKLSVKHKHLLINSYRDTRCKNEILTHNENKHPALKVKLLSELLDNDKYKNATVIGIDESQFYPDLVEFITSQLNSDKIFIIAGLDSDCNQSRWINVKSDPVYGPWGDIIELVHLANTVTKLNACCEDINCKEDAIFTKRHKQSNDYVGGKDLYIPICRYHLTNNVKKL